MKYFLIKHPENEAKIISLNEKHVDTLPRIELLEKTGFALKEITFKEYESLRLKALKEPK